MNNLLRVKWLAGALVLVGVQAGCGSNLPEAPPPMGSIEQNVTQVSDDPPSQQLKNDVAAALVDGQSVPDYHPELLPLHLEPALKVVQNVNAVWVTFFQDGAGHRSALGYYTYPEGQPPTSPPSLATRQANIIFPNTSNASEPGGTLVQGNRMLLGSFPAGTRIGFFLIANGCPKSTAESTGCTAANLDYSKPTYYSTDSLNPETNPSLKRHVLMVNHRDQKRLVLSFEDQNRTASDHDFNDVTFVVSWDPEPGIPYTHPGIDPDSSCQAHKTRYPNAVSGVYRLDPCGNGVIDDYYCDMSTPGAGGVVGGWTVGGWQPANATTTLGVTNRGAVLDANWSRKLQCLPFNEALVFNRTYNKYFTETLRGDQFRVTSVPYALGEPGRSFNQGTYVGNTMMGCVSYNYDNSLDAQWGCTTDPWFGGTARGHIAEDALQYNCDPAVLGQWAWADNTSCSHIDQMYTWGLGVR